ncbi:MAG: hypothetical protein U0L49_00155 [Eubacterium sp.]|nr:hypothetical protein [Eubacterium sp.]
MYRANKPDWKLFQAKIGEWQENYIARLNQEYIHLLSGDGHASDKFWALNDRMKEDRRHPGVMLRVEKSEMLYDIRELLRDGVIEEKDLEGFSEELKEEALFPYRGVNTPGEQADTNDKKPASKVISMESELALMINQPEEGVALFHELADFGINISYTVVSRGENKGKIHVRKTRNKDSEAYLDVEKLLRRRSRGTYLDHTYYFRTDDDRTVVTMSPYIDLSELTKDMPKNGKPHKLGDYCIWVSTHSIYGNGTPTICVWEDI